MQAPIDSRLVETTMGRLNAGFLTLVRGKLGLEGVPTSPTEVQEVNVSP